MKRRLLIGLAALAMMGGCSTTKTTTNPDGTATVTTDAVVIDTQTLTVLTELAAQFIRPTGARSMPSQTDPTLAAAVAKAQAILDASK